ncbi:uncharacterized protein LOC128673549 [Plodia interpunctella]|uniref:uncharacterized protein LOC128673549 n=1 Tax=Plodia interpunctella TaxID=58824 RepID=UPI002367AC9A|nr:uncharacterized protein LOC128673549 [Plodia interpunctella]
MCFIIVTLVIMYDVLMLFFYLNTVKVDSINIYLPDSSDAKYVKLFDFYKSKYGKTYVTPEDEKNAFLNFIDNEKKVEDLNEHTNGSTYYAIGRYGDIDPDYMEEHYGVTVNPIVTEPLHNIKADIAKEVQRTKKEKILEEAVLFDLDNAEELYESYMKEHRKKIPKNKVQRQIHFLRFVKSMVAVNKNHVNGDGDAVLDEYADEVKEPDEFSY